MKIHKCDLCGKFFNAFDEQEHFGLHYHNVGYGSKYDGCHIDIDMCCDCFAKWYAKNTRDFSRGRFRR